MIQELVAKLGSFERKVASEKGPFNLFLLLLREELTSLTSTGPGGTTGRWDLVVAAPWIYEDKKKNFAYFSKKLRAHLGQADLLSISRLALLRPDNPFVEAVNKGFQVEHGNVELVNTNLFGIEVNRAYVITSRRSNKPTGKEPATARK